MIQSLDSCFDKDGYRITSEWEDTSFIGRLLVQEPMRTSFKLDVKLPSRPEPSSLDAFLNQPYSNLLSLYRGGVTLQEQIEMTPEAIDDRLKELGAESVEDYLAAWGFRRVEVLYGGELVAARDLKKLGRSNVQWVGGD